MFCVCCSGGGGGGMRGVFLCFVCVVVWKDGGWWGEELRRSMFCVCWEGGVFI